MFRRLSISAMLTIVVLLVSIVMVGGVAINAIVQAKYLQIVEKSEIMAKAGRYQALVDMHHDGVKGALYRVLYAAQTKQADMSAPLEELEKQSESLKSRLKQLSDLDLPVDLRALIAPMDKPLLDYISAAAKVAKSASADQMQHAAELLPAFESVFRVIEVAQDKVGEAIEKAGEALTEESHALGATTLKFTFGVGALFILTFAGLILFLRRQVANPLRRIAGAIEQITAGEAHIKIETKTRQDEIGTVFQALSAFQEQRRAAALEAAGADARLAETARQHTITHAVDDFQVSIRQTRSGLSQGIEDLSSASQDVSAMAVDAERGTRSVAQSSQISTQAAQQIAQATSEMRASIQEIASQINVASNAISNTSELGTVSRTNVTQLAAAADKIDSVIELIRSIAGQTNLLALNATIEAARAGDAGRGFAVVATEVKALAGQTEQATNEIAAQIAAVKASINITVAGIRDMVSAFGQAEGAISSIAGAIEEQTSTSGEIAEAAGTAAASAAQTAEYLADVVQVVERARNSTALIEQVAQSLETRSQDLGHSVDQFLGSVKAA